MYRFNKNQLPFSEMMKSVNWTTAILMVLAIACNGQDRPTETPEEREEMSFEEYDPTSGLQVPEHPITRAKYPFIDVHNHQWRLNETGIPDLVTDMDRINMGIMVNLSGRSGKELEQSIENIRVTAPGRIVLFANVDFDGVGNPDWAENAVAQLRKDVEAGAVGLKIFKNLGLYAQDTDGLRIPVDDPRLDPIWALCGELGIPVLIHSADPRQFWEPMTASNERWLELKLRPRRKRGPDNPAPWEQIIAEQHRMFRKHPKTKFINAHFGWMAGDLGSLSKLMDEMPNIYVEFGAVIAELGRQPRFAGTFFEKYQDRILFGKDAWNPDEYATYFRVLETEDEYFPYYKKYHAFWRMYGLGLSDEILKKIYYKNALKLIPGLDDSFFPN